MRSNRFWHQGLAQMEQSLARGALVPLSTELLVQPKLEPFLLRRLLSRPPKHLRMGGPKPNPFLPWENDLEVAQLGTSHVLILNKYPVQQAHLLLISRGWQPQSGWLSSLDWQAVAHVAADTDGLWFFNSSPSSGASQPHRHLQLQPRHPDEPACPLEPALLAQLRGEAQSWPWRYALSARDPKSNHQDLEALYLNHAARLGLGHPLGNAQPQCAHNVIFCDRWFLTICRSQEQWAGFSLNALGFGGYLLATENSDLTWLEQHGALALLAQVAPAPKTMIP